MAKSSQIVVANIYRMLVFALPDLSSREFRSVSAEPFENAKDLVATLLATAMELRIKAGASYDYRAAMEETQSPHGQIQIPETAVLRSRYSVSIACLADQYTSDTALNRAAKACAYAMSCDHDVRSDRRRRLRSVCRQLPGVTLVGLDEARRSLALIPRRLDRFDGLVAAMTRLFLDGCIPNEDSDDAKKLAFDDGRMLSKIYEKFLLGYFEKRHPELNPGARRITNSIEDPPSQLPGLLTDVTLTKGNKVLIIDAKCYGHILTTHFDKDILNPGNVHQLITYVTTSAYGTDCEVSGMLLYASTINDGGDLRGNWRQAGHEYYFDTVDLGSDFAAIERKLEWVASLLD